MKNVDLIFSLVLILLSFTNSLHKNKAFMKKTSMKTKEETCPELTEFKNQMEEFQLNVEELLEHFADHIKLYKSWINQATSDEESLKYKTQELKYFDEYIKQADKIGEAIPIFIEGFEAELQKACPEIYKMKTNTNSQNDDDSGQDISGSTNSSLDVDDSKSKEDANSTTESNDPSKPLSLFIQLVQENYSELHSKPNPQLLHLIQLKSKIAKAYEKIHNLIS
jgi:hypothetical protein